MRHPQRWLLVLTIVLVAGMVSAGLAFGDRPVEWAMVVISVPLALVPLVFKARRQGARPSVFTWFWAAVGSGGFAWACYVVLTNRSWILFLFSLPWVAYARRQANSWFQFDIKEGQDRREVAAKDTARRIMAGERTPGPFALYLRPFASTGRLPAQPSPPEDWDRTVPPAHLDVETLFDRALRDRCPLLALGRSGDIAEGAARIATSDQEWRSLVAALAEKAALIIMVPLASPSTSWELGWLTEHDLLGKVLMVMPETRLPVSFGYTFSVEKNDRVFDWDRIFTIERADTERHQLDLVTEWRQAIQAAQDIGVELPVYAGVGALFTIDATSRQVARILPLPLSTISYGRRAGYVRTAITTLGIFTAESDPPPDLASALAHAALYPDTTELTLTRAADGFVLWGDTRTAAIMLTHAAAQSPHPPGLVHSYLKGLPELIHQHSRQGDHQAAVRYEAGIAALLEYPELAALVGRNPLGTSPRGATVSAGRWRRVLGRYSNPKPSDP